MFNSCGQGAARQLALTRPAHTHTHAQHTITIHFSKKTFLKADTHTHTHYRKYSPQSDLRRAKLVSI